MLTNRKAHLVKMYLPFCIILMTLSGYGQNFISDIRQNGNVLQEISITLTPPKGNPSKTTINKNTPVTSGTILEVPVNTAIEITSINGNKGLIMGPSTTQFTASSTSENYRVIAGRGKSNVVLNVFKKLTGGVLASGPTGKLHARSRLTQFSLSVDGDSAVFKLIEGKIDINKKQIVEILDKDILDSAKMRNVFFRQTTPLDLKSSDFNYNTDKLQAQKLTLEEDINAFFKLQLKEQKKLYTKSGKLSKQAFKYLDNGAFDEGIELLEKAIEQGEMTLDLVLQSSLMLADSYFNKDNINKSVFWLDAGLHFNKVFYELQEEVFNYYSDINKDKTAKAFGNDLVVANQFRAWAFTLKLRIHGCLENANENPSFFRKEAQRLETEISSYQ